VTNSLVGAQGGDPIGSVVTALPNGDYVIQSYNRANGATTNAGAVTLAPGTGGAVGPLSGIDSVFGTVTNGGFSMRWTYDAVDDQLVVGRPAENIVTFFGKARYQVAVPIVYR
jgi:hypothetical protein